MRLSNRNTHRMIRVVLAAAMICAVAVPGTAQAQDKGEAQEQSSPAVSSASPAAMSKPGAKLRENSYYYSAFNRRDPFRSLIEGVFVKNEKMALVNLNAVTLVGIVRGELDRFALLEDEDGFSYILRVGDRVRNGTVVSIGDQEMVARVTTFGQTTTVRLHLVVRKEGVKR